MNYQSLITTHAGSAYKRQLDFGDLLGQHSWEVNLDLGVASFGDGLSFPLQVIGTESESSQTWLWGWANHASGIPGPLLKVSDQLRDLGERESIPELGTEEIPLGGNVSGFVYGLLATAIGNQSAHYRGAYPGGALFFTVDQVPFPEISDPTKYLMRCLETMTGIMSLIDLDAKAACKAFLTQEGFVVEETSEKLKATSKYGTITLDSDDQGRITNIGI